MFDFSLLPLINPWLVLSLWLTALAFLLPMLLAGRWQIALLRALVISLLALALIQPHIAIEDHHERPTQALVISDLSASQTETDRDHLVKQADERLKQTLANNFDIEVVHHHLTEDSERGGTHLSAGLQKARNLYDAERLGAVFLITDGLLNDDADSLSKTIEQFPISPHVLLTQQPEAIDRRIEVDNLPRFIVTKKAINFSVTVIDEAQSGLINQGHETGLKVWLNGDVIWEGHVPIGDEQAFTFSLEQRGGNIIEIETEALAGELSLRNNRVSLPVNGIKDRFNVLLISGNIYPGVRVWRDLLKSDPSIDLVHFTILRPQSAIDATKNDELSLIAFPTQELFADVEARLFDFDLIISDRYSYRQILLPHYFDNIVRYVTRGGGIMIMAGNEYLGRESLALTPLINILPALPKGRSFSEAFIPKITDTGLKHPVTRDLIQNTDANQAAWGPWLEQIDGVQRAGANLISGLNDKPLLILNERGDGRVAMMLSADLWLWARGFKGGGPYRPLIKNLVHWLTKAPELEAERLSALIHEGRLHIERQTLADKVPSVTLTKNDGTQQTLTLKPTEKAGLFSTTIAIDDRPDITLTSDHLTARVIPNPVTAIEFERLIPSNHILEAALDQNKSNITPVSPNGDNNISLPALRMVTPSSKKTFGDNWLGIVDRKTTEVVGIQTIPLMDGWWALVLLVGALALLWWRESR